MVIHIWQGVNLLLS